MNKDLIYALVYYLAVSSIIALYFERITLSNYELTKHNFLLLSLIVPFLILMQFAYDALQISNGSPTRSIIIKVLGILFVLSMSFGILFLLGKYGLPHLFSKTTLIVIAIMASFWVFTSTNLFKTTLLPFITYSWTVLREKISTTDGYKILGLITLFGVIYAFFHSKSIFRKLMFPKHKVLLDKPIYLQKSTTIGTTEHLNVKVNDEKTKGKEKNPLDIDHNYAYSMKFYLNPQGPNTRIAYNKDALIATMGNNPSIYYNTQQDVLTLEFNTSKNGDGTTHVVIPLRNNSKGDLMHYQKWNSLVLNVNDGAMDVFLNGKLIHTEQIIPFYNIQAIRVGETRGLEGGIKEVIFYDNPLVLTQIHML